MMKKYRFLLLFLLGAKAWAAPGVREITSTSCKIIPVYVALGMTTQIVLEQEPKTTLFADKKHFKVVTNPSSPRSLAIIPVIESQELEPLKNAKGVLPSGEELASALNKDFTTNLFVFFDHSNQLQFQFHFVEKNKNDYILKVKEKFAEDCQL